MDFTRTSIVPKGRYKYGQYISAGNVAVGNAQYIYGGNASTGGNSGVDNEPEIPQDDANFIIFLEKTYNTFSRQELAVSARTDSVRVVAYRNNTLTPVYIMDCSKEIENQNNIPASSSTYDITGLTTGLVVSVTGNGTTACTLNITMDNSFEGAGGALTLQANVSSDFNVSGDTYGVWLMENEVNSAKFGGNPSLFTSVLQYSYDIGSDSTASAGFLMTLTNDSAGINCDSAGNVLSGAVRPTCSAELWYGTDKITGATFTGETTTTAVATGVTVAANGDISFGSNFNFLGSNMEVIVRCDYSGLTFYKVMTITKQYPGADGTGATTRWLKLSHTQIKYNPNLTTGQLSPTTINVKVMKQVNDEQPVEDTSTVFYWDWDTENPTGHTAYTNTNINVVVGHSYLAVGLRNTGNVFYELETIDIIGDGVNGTSGTPGQSVYRLQLSNMFSFVNVTSGGTVVSGQESNISTTATLYYGESVATGVTYSIVENFGNYITINSSTGVVTFSNGWGSNGWGNYFTGNTMVITIQARVNNILRGETTYQLVKNYPPATSSYVLDLSREGSTVNMTLPRDNTGTSIYASSISRLSCTATLYYGSGVTAGATYGLVGNYTGVSINSSTGVLSFGSNFNFTGDNLDIVVSAKTSNTERGRKTMTISKVYPGADGQGEPGEPAVSYWGILSADAVHVSSGGTADPSTVKCVVWKQVGGEAPTTTNDLTLKYGIDTSAATVNYNSTTGIVTSALTGNSYITITATHSGDGIVRFSYTVPILRDGKSSTSTYVLDLSRENSSVNMTLPRDNTGTSIYSSSISRLSCTATLYYGEAVATGVTYALVGTYTGVSINSSTGVMSFGSNFNFTGDNLDIVVKASVGISEKGRKTMTISKVYPGADGEDGSPGSPAISYWANLNADAIHVDSGGTATPTAITVISAWEQEGGDDPQLTSDIVCKYGYDTDNPATAYNGIPIVVTGHTGNTYLTIVGIHVDDNKERFRYTIPILHDGDRGDDGEDAVKYWLVLNASAVHVNSGATVAEPNVITAQAWEQKGGDTPVQSTSCTILYGFNTTNPSVNYPSTGITVNPSKSYITIKLKKDNKQYDIQTIPILKDGPAGQGIQGRMGAAVRGPYEWTGMEDRRFCSGSEACNPGDGPYEEDFLFIDVIFRMSGNTKVYYRCVSSYTQVEGATWAGVGEFWEQSDVDYDFVAADLILAQNGKITFLSGQEIYLMNSGGTVTGGARAADSADTVVFWAGSDEPSNGNFKVTHDGYMEATRGKIGPWVISGNTGLGYNSYDGTENYRNSHLDTDEISIWERFAGGMADFTAGLNGISYSTDINNKRGLDIDGGNVYFSEGETFAKMYIDMDVYSKESETGSTINFKSPADFSGGFTMSGGTLNAIGTLAPTLSKIVFLTSGNAYGNYFEKKGTTGSKRWYFNTDMNLGIAADGANGYENMKLGTSAMIGTGNFEASWVGMWLAYHVEPYYAPTGVYYASATGFSKKGDTLYITI